MINQSINYRNDDILIEAVLESGDEQAFRDLYRRHAPRLLGFVTRLFAGQSSENEDIVQETWVRACENLGNFQRRSAFSTWLLGIGLNVVRDNLRRNRRHNTAREIGTDNSHARTNDHEMRIDLQRAISMLPDDNRMVMVLHDIEGFTHDEIAIRLEIPVGTSKSQLFRARRMIRDWLTESNGAKP